MIFAIITIITLSAFAGGVIYLLVRFAIDLDQKRKGDNGN
jgi:hypothetical protein